MPSTWPTLPTPITALGLDLEQTRRRCGGSWVLSCSPDLRCCTIELPGQEAHPRCGDWWFRAASCCLGPVYGRCPCAPGPWGGASSLFWAALVDREGPPAVGGVDVGHRVLGGAWGGLGDMGVACFVGPWTSAELVDRSDSHGVLGVVGQSAYDTTVVRFADALDTWSLGIVSNAERRISVGSPHGKRRHGV